MFTETLPLPIDTNQDISLSHNYISLIIYQIFRGPFLIIELIFGSFIYKYLSYKCKNIIII